MTLNAVRWQVRKQSPNKKSLQLALFTWRPISYQHHPSVKYSITSSITLWTSLRHNRHKKSGMTLLKPTNRLFHSWSCTCSWPSFPCSLWLSCRTLRDNNLLSDWTRLAAEGSRWSIKSLEASSTPSRSECKVSVLSKKLYSSGEQRQSGMQS